MPTAAPPTAGPDLCFLLTQASHALQTELTAALSGLGISPRAHCVLTNALAGDLTQGELAERCALDKTTMVVTLDELEQAGLALRRPSSADRRARIIEVTDAGRAMVARSREIVDGIHADVLTALPDAERQAFLGALSRLVGGRLGSPVPCEKPVRRRAPRPPVTRPS